MHYFDPSHASIEIFHSTFIYLFFCYFAIVIIFRKARCATSGYACGYRKIRRIISRAHVHIYG